MSIIEQALEKGKSKPSEQPKKAVEKAISDVSGETRNVIVSAGQAKFSGVDQKRLDPKPDLTLDTQNLERGGLLKPDEFSSSMAEEYRQIKRPLLMNAFGADTGIERANLILVTSSLPGEGKTYNAINLALSIAAERERTVLLIDADVAKPSVSNMLGIKVDLGLIDYLESPDVSFSDVLLRTNMANLSIIPAGKRHKHSTELLASDAMKKMVHELSTRYSDRVVIFDSPPLLAASQGAVLASLVGQVVMVVEAEKTPQHLVKEAISIIEDCDVVGCVLNKKKKGPGFNYYYGYGYGGYGGYGTYGQ